VNPTETPVEFHRCLADLGETAAALRQMTRHGLEKLADAMQPRLKARGGPGDTKSSLGDAESSLGVAKSSLGDAKSSLGNAKSSLGDAKSSLGDA
jgi:hypothetical protein